MKIIVAATLGLALVLGSTLPASSQAEPCRFVLGFASLREQIGAAKVGSCLDNESFNVENGNAEQRASGGLLVWRKIDNWTAFTDGSLTWINGPGGLVTRPNSERFVWEKDPVAPSSAAPPRPTVTPLAAPAAPAATEAQVARAPQPPAPTAVAAPVAGPVAAPPLASTTASAPSPAPVEIKGRGRQTTETFDLRAGLLVVSSTHQGKSNFIVRIVDANGKESALVANTIGDSRGTRATKIEAAGRYGLNVTADGPWTVRMEQPTPRDLANLPRTFTGKGDGVTGWVRLPEGRVVAKATTTSGRANFIVRAVGENGDQGDLLANEVGVASSSKAFEGRGRTVLLSVQADGDWTVRLEE